MKTHPCGVVTTTTTDHVIPGVQTCNLIGVVSQRCDSLSLIGPNLRRHKYSDKIGDHNKPFTHMYT